jgi:hypothetical protein
MSVQGSKVKQFSDLKEDKWVSSKSGAAPLVGKA